MLLKSSNDKVYAYLSFLGYDTLYPPQQLAIERGLLDHTNLLITTPTASGKTLIAILAAIKTLEKNKKVVYLTPLRALAYEKYQEFTSIDKSGIFSKKIKVKISTGDFNTSNADLSSSDVIIMTNEKIDSIMRHSASWLSNVGLFISDEIHLIGDQDRGPVLEMVLTKIKKYYPSSQILGLSATITNAVEIAEWLNSKLIESSWRPTKLIEGVYSEGIIHCNNNTRYNVTESGRDTTSMTTDLIMDSLQNNVQSLVFVETRKRAVSLAKKVSDLAYTILSPDERKNALNVSKQILEEGDDTDLTKNLSKLISSGIGFHHAGLSLHSRGIVEDAFKKGLIKSLFATPTLAAGVNLPARRVIITNVTRYDFMYGASVPISILEYKQLCGRAGRPKYDTHGESIILSDSRTSHEELYEHYILGIPEPLNSNLGNAVSIKLHLLGLIASFNGISLDDIYDLFSKTFYSFQDKNNTSLFDKIDSALDYFMDEDLVSIKDSSYRTTAFGKLVSNLYLNPETAVSFREIITNIKPRSLSTNNVLGFLQVITSCSDFYPKFSFRKQDIEEFNYLFYNNYDEFFTDIDIMDCSRSLWTLYEWIDESTEKRINERIGIEPGDIHRMVEVAQWLISSIFEIAKLQKRNDLLPIIFSLESRIKHGVKAELVPLVQIKDIGRARARSLYSTGIHLPNDLITISETKLALIPKIGPKLAKKLKKKFT
ncbi:DEAD/DEAH box helicase [Candidatus Nitrosocosmicus agrestis]|jgi:helicase|uniref:DEAD/DEAH box helicase n=1 Tax=Candidatus Nitrosocosmicus agrestis TaxID=2563600 RepID=UPI00122DFEEB|nr:DEAD/DEAH box helicase [Candidatus Nitrosocosmicus sp. SS]KAA2282858.1 DEAD/DEAH box helicase [Candidatus Nitrosocosmicus sp. SS]KAF0869060.1 DEAD/DEAH box helicase [Candidatus Nitrosocosmicus sp. SS]MDR4489593.1 DEAD/DEAH box helicase [Candidatus Nitrosocosmicus sp.]